MKERLTNLKALDLLIENLDEIHWLLFIINMSTSKDVMPWKYYWSRLDKAMKTVEYMWRYINEGNHRQTIM